MKISKIIPKRNGVDGMIVVFEKVEAAQDGLSYNNEYQGTFKMPVSFELRAAWREAISHFKKILNLNPKLPDDDILVNWIQFNGDGSISASLKIRAIHNRWYAANIPAIESDEDYRDYDTLYDILEKLWECVGKYCLGSMVATPKQYMLDLFDNANRSGKEFDLTREEIDNLDQEEVLKIVREKLEAKGDVFLIKAGEDNE